MKTVRKKAARPANASPKAKRAGAATPTVKKPAPRADLGAPVEVFFARQPPHLRPIADELRKMIEKALPGAASTIKWGMPFYSLHGATICAIGAHKAHVNLILAGSPDSFSDPDGLLEGEGKTGKHLKVKSVEGIPRDAVRGWLRSMAEKARGKNN